MNFYKAFDKGRPRNKEQLTGFWDWCADPDKSRNLVMSTRLQAMPVSRRDQARVVFVVGTGQGTTSPRRGFLLLKSCLVHSQWQRRLQW